MKIELSKEQFKCEEKACKNQAKFHITANKIFNKDSYLCVECLKKFYQQIGKLIIPKGIENINKRIKIKE